MTLMRESFRMIKKLARAHTPHHVVRNIMDNSFVGKETEPEKSSYKTETHMRVTGEITRGMAMESLTGIMAASIKESGRTISWMEVGSLSIRMGSRNRWLCQKEMLLRRDAVEASSGDFNLNCTKVNYFLINLLLNFN